MTHDIHTAHEALEAAAQKNENFAAQLDTESFMFLLRDQVEASRFANEVAKLFRMEAGEIRALSARIAPVPEDVAGRCHEMRHMDCRVVDKTDEARIDRVLNEAADLIEAQARELARLREALIWCSGSADFHEGGVACKGWLKLCAPLIAPKGDSHE